MAERFMRLMVFFDLPVDTKNDGEIILTSEKP